MDTQNVSNQEQVNLELNPSNSKLEKLSLIVLLVTIIVSSVIFSTTNQSPLDTAKTITISMGILISGILYFIALFNKKTIYFPKSALVLIIPLIALSTIISTFFSSNFNKSFFGQGFEFTTASFTLLMMLASSLVVQLVYKNKERLYYIMSSIFAVFVLLMVFHVLRLFNISIFSFGVFNSSTSTLIGRWTDLGVFSGLVLLITFISLNLAGLKGLKKIYIWLLFVLSLFFVIVINNPILWAVLASSFLGYSVYNYKYSKKISIPSAILTVISIVLMIWGTNIISPLTK